MVVAEGLELAEGQARVDNLGVDLASLALHEAVQAGGFAIVAQLWLETLDDDGVAGIRAEADKLAGDRVADRLDLGQQIPSVLVTLLLEQEIVHAAGEATELDVLDKEAAEGRQQLTRGLGAVQFEDSL